MMKRRTRKLKRSGTKTVLGFFFGLAEVEEGRR